LLFFNWNISKQILVLMFTLILIITYTTTMKVNSRSSNLQKKKSIHHPGIKYIKNAVTQVKLCFFYDFSIHFQNFTILRSILENFLALCSSCFLTEFWKRKDFCTKKKTIVEKINILSKKNDIHHCNAKLSTCISTFIKLCQIK